MAVKKTNTPAKKKNNAVTDPMPDFAADAGMGMEGTDSKSFAIPFLAVLQSNSPQVEDETVEGAKAGLFINTITSELLEAVEIIPCAFQRRFNRWAPRSEGGGFKGELNPIDVDTGAIEGVHQGEDEKGNSALMIENDVLKDTRNHFVLMRSASGSWQPALLSLSSTQIKKSKRFMSRIQGIELRTPEGKAYNPASFSHVYKLGVVKEENNQGKWWGITIDLIGPVEDAEAYAKAKSFHADAVAGMIKTEQPVEEAASSDGDDGGKF